MVKRKEAVSKDDEDSVAEEDKVQGIKREVFSEDVEKGMLRVSGTASGG